MASSVQNIDESNSSASTMDRPSNISDNANQPMDSLNSGIFNLQGSSNYLVAPSSLNQQMEYLQLFSMEMTDLVHVSADKESKEFEDSIESMLTRLDEYCTLIDLIRSDTAHCVTKSLPKLQEKATEMEQIFRKIEQLEVFVKHVAETVNNMEMAVEKSEKDLGQMTSIKKSFLSKFSTKSALERVREPKLQFQAPSIFHVDDWLASQNRSVNETCHTDTN